LNDGEQKIALRWSGFWLAPDFSKIPARALSTNPVDKFVDYRWADRRSSQETARKSAAAKISAVLSKAETGAYEIESGSVRDSRARL
jgi:hypothetical protein